MVLSKDYFHIMDTDHDTGTASELGAFPKPLRSRRRLSLPAPSRPPTRPRRRLTGRNRQSGSPMPGRCARLHTPCGCG